MSKLKMNIDDMENDFYDDGTVAINPSLEDPASSNEDDNSFQDSEPVIPSLLRRRNANIALDRGAYSGSKVNRSQLEELESNSDSDDNDVESINSEYDMSYDNLMDEENTDKDEDRADIEDVEDIIRDFEEQDQVLISQKSYQPRSNKSKHTKNLQVLWGDLLELQIFSKRIYSNANSLPKHNLAELNYNKDESDVIQEKSSSISQTLSRCTQLMLRCQNYLSSIVVPNESESSFDESDPSVEKIWECVSHRAQQRKREYEEMAEKCAESTTLDAKSNREKRFKTVNQSVMSQVEAVLADPERVRRKAHCALGSFNITGDNPNENESNQIDANDHQLDDELYDDADFYHELLKEYLENNSSSELNDLMMKRRKKKKRLPHRASKGRQLKYTVHPKLQNYMYPVNVLVMDMDIDELYNSIFKSL